MIIMKKFFKLTVLITFLSIQISLLGQRIRGDNTFPDCDKNISVGGLDLKFFFGDDFTDTISVNIDSTKLNQYPPNIKVLGKVISSSSGTKYHLESYSIVKFKIFMSDVNLPDSNIFIAIHNLYKPTELVGKSITCNLNFFQIPNNGLIINKFETKGVPIYSIKPELDIYSLQHEAERYIKAINYIKIHGDEIINRSQENKCLKVYDKMKFVKKDTFQFRIDSTQLYYKDRMKYFGDFIYEYDSTLSLKLYASETSHLPDSTHYYILNHSEQFSSNMESKYIVSIAPIANNSIIIRFEIGKSFDQDYSFIPPLGNSYYVFLIFENEEIVYANYRRVHNDILFYMLD